MKDAGAVKGKLSRRSFAAGASLCIGGALTGAGGTLLEAAEVQTKAHPPKRAANDAQWVRPKEGSEEESLPDGSTGRVSEYRGCEGSFIAAYVRRPKGAGPFPIVVVLHGGGVSPNAAYGMGRSNPLTDRKSVV